MKKLIVFGLMPLCLGLILFGTKTANACRNVSSIAHAGVIYCYYSYSLGGDWSIYDCSDCSQIDNVKITGIAALAARFTKIVCWAQPAF